MSLDVDDLLKRVTTELGGSAGLERVEACLKQTAGIEPCHDGPAPLQRPTALYFPYLRNQAWYDAEEFAFAEPSARHFPGVRAELQALIDNAAPFSPYEDPYSKELGFKGWRVLPLYTKGRWSPRSRARCPETARFLDGIDHGDRQALFSRLEPGAHIAPHSGGSNVVLTCHLALIVHEGCGIRVGEELRSWREGACLVFDDSYIHEAWNRGESDRYVLIWDVWHPDLTEKERRALTLLSSVFRQS